jgi:hypothetical protein
MMTRPLPVGTHAEGRRALMKRLNLVGLCLAAVFALCAMAAGSATASPPEYKTCIKAEPKNTGNYSEKTCSDTSKVAGTGKYERAEWNKGKKVTFKGKNVGTPKNIIVNPLDTPAKTEGTTECTKEKPEGEVTGPKTTKWTTHYKKCKGNGVPCNTTGAGKEEIVTDTLESTLASLDKGPGHKRVGIRVKGLGPGGRLAQYECPETKITVEVFGEVLAETKGNLNSAAKSGEVVVKGGPLNLQSDLYEEETNSEEEGKKFFEWGFAFEECVAEQIAKGHTQVQAETICIAKVGPPPAPQPISLISVVKGAINAKAPAVQNGVTINKGESMLIEDN